MDILPWRTQIFLGSIVSIALFAIAYAITAASVPNGSETLLAASFGVLMLVSWLFPLPLSFKARFYLDTVVIVAAVLVFEPGIAMATIGIGTLIAQIIQRRIWDEALFNTAQTVLQAGVGAWVLAEAGWNPLQPAFGDLRLVTAIGISGLAILATNQILVGGIISSQAGINPIGVWTQQILLSSPIELLGQLAQIGLGIVAAFLASSHPWMIALLGFPMVALYRGAEQSFELRRRAEEARRLSEDALVEAQRVAHIGSWEWNLQTGIHVWSREVYRILGQEGDDATAGIDTLLSSVYPEDRDHVDQEIHKSLHSGEPFDIEHRVLSGTEVHDVQHRGEIMLDETGDKVRMIGTIHDITERKKLETQLTYLAFHDPLTGLANRAHIFEHIEERLQQGSGLVGLFFLDLDEFKAVNDRYGHESGDYLLHVFSQRLQNAVRSGDVPGRLGGDEFTVLIPTLSSEEMAEQIAARLIEVLTTPLHIRGESISITSSIGICVANAAEVNREQLLRRADTALYQAKRLGRNRYVVYHPGLPSPSDAARFRELTVITRGDTKTRVSERFGTD